MMDGTYWDEAQKKKKRDRKKGGKPLVMARDVIDEAIPEKGGVDDGW
jgi:hypothetical protein